MREQIFRTGLKILKATVAVSSNRKSLLPLLPPRIEVKSLLTDFKELEKITYSPKADGLISVFDTGNEEATYSCEGDHFQFKGPFVRLSRLASDLRFSLWGNQGFLYRFALRLLEKKYRVFSFHACALYQAEKKRLFIIAGHAGSGKTIYLLSGLEKGLRLFSTETVHFKQEGSTTRWFMGSLVDNVRLGTLRHHFPRFLPRRGIPAGRNEWQRKIAINLCAFQHNSATLLNPQISILFPHVEEGYGDFILSPLRDVRSGAKALFDNLSEKIASSFLLYDRLPMTSLDEPGLTKARLEAAEKLIAHPKTSLVGAVLTHPMSCWGDLLSKD